MQQPWGLPNLSSWSGHLCYLGCALQMDSIDLNINLPNPCLQKQIVMIWAVLFDSAGHGALQIPHSVFCLPPAGFLSSSSFKFSRRHRPLSLTLFSTESYKVSANMDLRDYLSNHMNADPLIFIHLFNMYLFMAQYVLDLGAELQGLLSKVNSPRLQDFWYNRNSSLTQNGLLSENKRWSYCWNKIWVLVCGQNISSQ